MNICNVIISDSAAIAGKMAVQVNADATRAHFGDGRGGGVQKPGLVSLFSDPMGSTYWNPTFWRMLTNHGTRTRIPRKFSQPSTRPSSASPMIHGFEDLKQEERSCFKNHCFTFVQFQTSLS
jgi:hypothetical protein